MVSINSLSQIWQRHVGWRETWPAPRPAARWCGPACNRSTIGRTPFVVCSRNSFQASKYPSRSARGIAIQKIVRFQTFKSRRAIEVEVQFVVVQHVKQRHIMAALPQHPQPFEQLIDAQQIGNDHHQSAFWNRSGRLRAPLSANRFGHRLRPNQASTGSASTAVDCSWPAPWRGRRYQR